jgi:uncharacterized membrane protein (DUF106 family)
MSAFTNKMATIGVDIAMANSWEMDLQTRLRKFKDRKKEIQDEIDAAQLRKATVQAEIDRIQTLLG